MKRIIPPNKLNMRRSRPYSFHSCSLSGSVPVKRYIHRSIIPVRVPDIFPENTEKRNLPKKYATIVRRSMKNAIIIISVDKSIGDIQTHFFLKINLRRYDDM